MEWEDAPSLLFKDTPDTTTTTGDDDDVAFHVSEEFESLHTIVQYHSK